MSKLMKPEESKNKEDEKDKEGIPLDIMKLLLSKQPEKKVDTDVCNNGHKLVMMYETPPAYTEKRQKEGSPASVNIVCSLCRKKIKCSEGIWHCDSDNYEC